MSVPTDNTLAYDVANTSNKLWKTMASSVISPIFIREWDLIGPPPYTATLSGDFTLPSTLTTTYETGLCAIDDTTLIWFKSDPSGGEVWELSLLTNPVTITSKFTTDIVTSGDFIITTGNKLIILGLIVNGGTDNYISQYDYTTGVLEFRKTVLGGSQGIGQFAGEIYLFNYDPTLVDPNVYSIDTTSPYNQTLITTSINAFGASSSKDCNTAEFIPEPTPTPTETPTPTPTPTSTPTPTPTPTSTPTPTPTPTTPEGLCTVINYCLYGTGNSSWDDNYVRVDLYDGNFYWSGSVNSLYIYYDIVNTQWCLSDSLGGNCLLSGKSPCYSICPDLCDDYLIEGVCPTPTPTPEPPCDVDFTALFDCEYEPTPTPTPTPTLTPTPTPTPTPTSVCNNVAIDATINSTTPTPTPTTTPTPTPTPTVDRPCNFLGNVIFNTINGLIKCPSSKQFQDCFNGDMYYTTSVLENPTQGEDIEPFMVFEAIVDGISKCVSYVGVNNDTIGINQINLVVGPFGYSNLGDCINCTPQTTPTPTPTTTPTPTPTPTSTPTPTPTSSIQTYYVYVNCSNSNTVLVQTLPALTTTNGSVLYDQTSKECWEFDYQSVGYPQLNPQLNVINYTGNYLINAENQVYTDCQSCLGTTPEPYGLCTSIIDLNGGTINGNTVTVSHTGSVIPYPFTISSCTSISAPSNSIWVGQFSSFTLTFSFSQPVNNLIFVIDGYDSPETFTFITNTGTPTISSPENCGTLINGNQISSSGVYFPGNRAGKFIINNTSNYTSITITGPGGANGSAVALCAD